MARLQAIYDEEEKLEMAKKLEILKKKETFLTSKNIDESIMSTLKR